MTDEEIVQVVADALAIIPDYAMFLEVAQRCARIAVEVARPLIEAGQKPLGGAQ